jgi:uncharacterized phage-associated protein
MHEFNHTKAVQALNYFATLNGGRLNKMKAIKLLWLSDRLHLRRYARTITGDTYFAMKLGPVPSNTRDILKGNVVGEYLKYRDAFINTNIGLSYSSTINPNLKVFSKTDIQILDAVYKEYGNKSQFELSDFSHEFPEWKKWENEFIKSSSSIRIDFNDFFKDPENEVAFFNEEPENIELIKQLFDKSKNNEC